MNKIKYLSLKLCTLIFLLFLLFVSKVRAEESNSINQTTDLSLSLGNLCEYIGQIQTDDKGSKNKCSFLPSLSGTLDYYFLPTLAFSPQIGLTLPKSGRDENITRMTFFTMLNLKYRTTYLNLFTGAGLYFTRISGSGGEETLNNGNGSDSFPLPKEAVYSRNLVVNLGASVDFTHQWSGELYTYIFNLTTKEDRAFSAGFSASYHFGEIL